jgi:hypothetical protein
MWNLLPFSYSFLRILVEGDSKSPIFYLLLTKNNLNKTSIMANQVRVGTFIYRINPNNDKEMQRCQYGSSSWSRVAEFNGNHILDLLLAPNGKDIEVYTDRYVYLREYSGNIRKK